MYYRAAPWKLRAAAPYTVVSSTAVLLVLFVGRPTAHVTYMSQHVHVQHACTCTLYTPCTCACQHVTCNMSTVYMCMYMCMYMCADTQIYIYTSRRSLDSQLSPDPRLSTSLRMTSPLRSKTKTVLPDTRVYIIHRRQHEHLRHPMQDPMIHGSIVSRTKSTSYAELCVVCDAMCVRPQVQLEVAGREP